jgi:hypothetical protein
MGDNHTCVVASDQPYCWGDSEEFGYEPTVKEGPWGPYNSWENYSTPQHIASDLWAGKKVVSLWGTSGSTFVNYLK